MVEAVLILLCVVRNYRGLLSVTMHTSSSTYNIRHTALIMNRVLLQSWARAGILPSHISTPRRLLLVLLAAAAPAATAAGTAAGGIDGLIEVSAALKLDWSRAFGLWFWYGVPFTEPVAAVTTAFTAALAAAAALPRPAPPYAAALQQPSQQKQQQQQQALVLYGQQQQQQQRQVQQDASDVTFAAADTQYALLQLHARGPYGLSVALLDNNSSSSSSSSSANGVGALLSKLLRVAGYSSNPLDYSTAWQLMTVLESLKALPSRTQDCKSHVMVCFCSSDEVSNPHISVVSIALMFYGMRWCQHDVLIRPAMIQGLLYFLLKAEHKNVSVAVCCRSRILAMCVAVCTALGTSCCR